MADIIKFVLPERTKVNVVTAKTYMTDEEYDARMDRIARTAEGCLEAIQISIDEAPWTVDHARDLSVLARELGNLFEVAANLIAARAALKGS